VETEPALVEGEFLDRLAKCAQTIITSTDLAASMVKKCFRLWSSCSSRYKPRGSCVMILKQTSVVNALNV